jgi:abortive infection bacteriophage resistance protein
MDRKTLQNITPDNHREFIAKLRKETASSREDFVKHYFSKYSSEHDLPLWMACELLTFGGTLTLFRHVEKEIKQAIATQFAVADKVLESWLVSLNFVRNICAHHGRLWNRGLTNKEPAIPRKHKHPQWHSPVAVAPNRMFAVLTILNYLMRQIAPQSRWRNRLLNLFDLHPDVPLKFMGFPDNWQECPIWKAN